MNARLNWPRCWTSVLDLGAGSRRWTASSGRRHAGSHCVIHTRWSSRTATAISTLFIQSIIHCINLDEPNGSLALCFPFLASFCFPFSSFNLFYFQILSPFLFFIPLALVAVVVDYCRGMPVDWLGPARQLTGNFTGKQLGRQLYRKPNSQRISQAT